MKWHWFPDDLREIAQAEVLDALLFVAQQDEEWVVRYSAVVGLQSLAVAIAHTHPDWRSQIQSQFEQMATNDESWAVRGRVCMAQQQLQTGTTTLPSHAVHNHPSSPPQIDWQLILEKLYERKFEERSAMPEGDPRRYRELAVAIAHKTDDA